jgi:nucleoside-diphosphate kinase
LTSAIVEMIETSLPIVKIVEKRVDKAPQELLLDHYSEHKGKAFFDPLIEYMQSGPIVISIWEGPPSIIQQLRDLTGATDPNKATPGTIRGKFAQSNTRNSIHASDSVESAEREISIWFSA